MTETNGDETVPTVFVGDRALVNPSVRQVLDAIRAADPGYRPNSTPATGRAGGAGTRKVLSAGLLWTLVVTVVWSVLVAWQPTTTWHLAPLILAAAWPWAVGQDTSSRDPSARRRILLAGGGGLGAALALTWVVSTAGRLDGPTWTGSGTPVTEALLLSVTGAAVATTMGLLRTVRRTTSASARLGTSLVATSNDIVRVEGNAYFRLSSVPDGVLQPSSTTSICPWKGVASYYDVHVDGQVVADGAFTYRHHSPLARRIKGRVAFWKGIEIDTTRPRPDLHRHRSATNQTDFSDLRAVIVNGTLKPSPTPGHTDGLTDISARVLRGVGACVDTIRVVTTPSRRASTRTCEPRAAGTATSGTGPPASLSSTSRFSSSWQRWWPGSGSPVSAQAEPRSCHQRPASSGIATYA